MKVQFLITLFFLLGWNCVPAQNFHFQQITSSDGLPSNNVYAFDQDSDQIMWIGTGSGISRFDGTTFTNYSTENGLINNEVYGLTIDHLDRKWMSTLAKKPSYFLNGTGQVPSWGDSLTITNYYFRSIDSLLWFSGVKAGEVFGYRPLSLLTDEGGLKVFPDVRASEGAPGVLIDSTIYVTGGDELFKYKDGSFLKVEGLTIPGGLIDCQPYLEGMICIQNQWPKSDAIIHIDIEKLRYEKLEIPLAEKRIKANTLLVDNNNQIWIGLTDGVLFIEDLNNIDKIDQFLDKTFVNQLYQDHENNIWVSTAGQGMYFLVSNSVRNIVRENKGSDFIVRSLEVDSIGRIFIGYTNGFLEVYDQSYNLIHQRKYSDLRIVDILINGQDIWLASDSEVFLLDQNYNTKDIYFSKLPIKSIGLVQGVLYVFSYNIERIFLNKIERLDFPINSRIYANFSIDENSILLGTTEGLYVLADDKLSEVNRTIINSDIKGISKDNSGNYWIATGGQGVFILDKKLSVITHLNKTSGLSSNICTDLTYSFPYMWVSTNKGLCKIHENNYDILLVDESNGLSSSEIEFLESFGNTILASSRMSVDYFAADLAVNKDPPILHFYQLNINGNQVDFKQKYVLPHNENNFAITFTGISYKSLGDISYAYRMEGLDKVWVETSANSANWSAIRPGEYTLKVKAKGRNGVWSALEEIQISIAPPWWQLWWFRIIGVLFVVSGLFIAFRRMRSNYRKQNTLQKRLQGLQLAALRAQMNPHFMFNALSSIQEYINKSDQEGANLYLSRFASLVRSVLNNSTRERISLEEEVSQLSIYLSLENLRFRKQINYRISVSPDLQISSVFIPTMIIQPFVENAIIHGLFHSKGLKELSVKFQLQEVGLLHCEILDNGVGRQKSMQINNRKKHKRESKGIQLTKDRLSLVNKTSEKHISVEVIDLESPDGIPTGTLVHLMIPYLIKNESND